MQDKSVFLTFDDGPNAGTKDVLDVLKALKVRATFFVTGSNVNSAGGRVKQKALAKRIVAEGHLLGNHCFRHKPANKEQYATAYGDLKKPEHRAAFKKNFDDNVDYFRRLLGDDSLKMKVARLPGDGRTIKVCVDETKRLGMKHIGWDYEFAPTSIAKKLKHIDKIKWQGIDGVSCTFDDFPPNNNVVLLHDLHWNGNAALLKSLLTRLKDNHRVFKTL